MLASSIPTRFPIPFANSAGGSYIRTIPTASQIGIQGGAASLTDGFPPLCFNPVASGGIPPFGQDMNGILNEITLWTQWENAGGPLGWNSAFSTAIGGYPKGALLNAATGLAYWYNLVDSNTTNPDASGANWQAISFGGTYAGNPNGNVAGVAVSANSITNSMLWDTTNLVLWICTTTGNAAGAIWTAVTGTVTGISVANSNGFNATVTGGATPVITMKTTVSGMVKGNGTALSAATPGGDYVSPGQFTGANQSLASPGYQEFPGGLILQWGLTASIASGSTPASTSFPIAFPNACLNVQLTFSNAAAPGTGKDMGPNLTATSTSGFTMTQQSGTGSQYQWSAIGY